MTATDTLETLETDPPEPAAAPNPVAGISVLVAGFAALGFFVSWHAVAFILALMVMIFLHELGHYLTAKSAGMQVTEFFLFFGPRIFSFRRGETEYGMKMIPAGAYVKITGMASFEEVPPELESRTYRQKPYWRRLSVAVAGSAMHFLIAIVLLFVTIMAYGSLTNSDGWAVDSITPGSAAEEAGLQPGDQLLAVNGDDATDFADLGPILEPYVGEAVNLTIERDGETLELSTVIGARLTDAGAEAIDGLLPLDILTAVEDTPVRTYDQFIAAIGPERIGQEVRVTAQGRGQEDPAEYVVVVEAVVNDASVGFLGVGPREVLDGVGPISAAGESLTIFGSFLKDSTVGLVKLLSPSGISGFLGDTFDGDTVVVEGAETLTARDLARLQTETLPEQSENRITSIYGIVQLGTTASAEGGMLGFLTIMIFVNIAIGVFNLIPALPFDGGHVVIATYEKIRSMVSGNRYYADATKALPLIYVVLAFFIVISIVALGRDIVDPL